MSNISNRLYFTAYLYAEYILRNIETNRPDLLGWLIEIKKLIQENFDMFSADILMDAVLENECFYYSSEYDCELFSSAIMKRLSSRDEYNNEIFVNCIQFISEFLKRESYFPKFQEIVKSSLEEGIYITHLDSFRNEGYSLIISNPIPKKFYLQHVFF